MQKFLIFKDGKQVQNIDFNQIEVGKLQVSRDYPNDQFKVFSFKSGSHTPHEVDEYLKTFQLAAEKPKKKNK